MAAVNHEIYLPQSDKNYVKTEDDTGLTEMLTDCLAGTSQLENNFMDVQYVDTDASNGVKVCCLCLTPDNLRPLPPSVRRFMTSLNVTPAMMTSCVTCLSGLRRAAGLAERAKATQAALARLRESGELNLTSINKIKSKMKPLMQLTTKLIESETYDRTYIYDEELQPQNVEILEVEPQNEIKNEENTEENRLSDIENDFDDNSDSDYDLPLKPKTPKKVKKPKVKVKVKVEEADPTFIRPYTKRRSTLSEDDRLMEEYFVTKILTLEEQKAECLKRKESRNYNKSQLKCEYCFKGFMHEKAYEFHMAKHSEKMGELTCKICHRHCSTKRVLRKHMDHHKYTFSCKKCDYESKAKSSAKLHIDWHKGKKYDCDKCGLSFERLSTVLSHKRIKHPSDHVCTLCGYSFLGDKGIYFHMQLKHKLDDTTIPDDGPLCTECNIRFKNGDALLTHERVSPRHGVCKRNDAPSKALRKSREGQETRGRRPLDVREPRDRRQRGQAQGRPVRCEQCGLLMSTSQEYRFHFNKMHPDCTRTQFPEGSKPSLCDLCGKMFKTPAILADHQIEHTDAPAAFACDTCGKMFKKKSSLALHRNVHLGRRYPCPICGKMFNQVCNRDRHYTYVHSTVKDVKCDYCEKFFKSDEEKKLHITYVHFKKPYPKRSRNKRQGIEGVKRKREGYIQEMVASHSWLQESESSEGSMPH